MSQSPAYPSPDASALPSILVQAATLMGAGRYEDAINVFLSAGELVSREPLACNTLGFLLLNVGRPQDAILWFETALSLKPDYVHAMSGLGMACQNAGDFTRALLCYESVVAAQPDDAASWYHQGAVLQELRRSVEALSSLERAIALKSDYSQALSKRSQVIESLRNVPDAIQEALRNCHQSPEDATSWSRLGDLLQKSGDFDRAIAAYDRGLSRFPEDFHCLCNKAQALEATGRWREGLATAQRALRVEPTDREALILCGKFELKLGNPAAAHVCFLTVAEMGVVRNYPAARKPAKFRVLLLFSPEAGNTPYEDLIRDSYFDTEVIFILRGYRNDPQVRSDRVDVVVNLVSETDFGLDVIASAIDVADSLERPVVNHPRLMLATDRESISRRLSHVASAVMPVTIRIEAKDLRRRVRDGDTGTFPLIVRHTGKHGGDMMELVADADALLSFAEEAGEQALYLTDFVDYSSPDGLFRKYRFLFIGDETLPYHLAIGDGWKVHHVTTRMSDVEWMRKEEEAFLNDPGSVFGPQGMAALDAIRRQIGLDYFGIDCSLDSEGRVVIFEVNASMLIHLHNERFEYKTPHVKRIKQSFEQLLERRATEYRASVSAAGDAADRR
ncbi:tetratricopeptide repeat protein [Rhizobium jaguaris]|uniref:Tetratricopeptide repeat protein n=1 Tax=Rhizobium jaguaris TaxID=1312183 RepID=A0A387FZS6_9HYPH|nr:tetratricopeptide repeat protein [Rhizobium jaguaris]AYG60716.1 tetratricopeptide repeat protein [Rhizobium jaguaris]